MIEDNIKLCRKELVEAKVLTGMTNDDIYGYSAANDAQKYIFIEKNARLAAGPFIPKYAFRDWLDFLNR